MSDAPNPLDMMINEMISRTPEKRKISLLGKTFWQYPTVFDSEFTYQGCEFLALEVSQIVRKELSQRNDQEVFDMLEIGSGTGHASIEVALSFDQCRIWATDINPQAIENTLENAKLHSVADRVQAYLGDVYDAPQIRNKQFDLIFWSFPFVPASGPNGGQEGVHLDPLVRGLVDPGYNGLRDYLAGARAHLKKDGRILLAFSFELGSEHLLKKIMEEVGWSYKVLAEAEVELSFTIFPMSMKNKVQLLEAVCQ
ncbi:uncharacterized protein LOC116292570 [Actinia tenebrosa]|uniref:Uncharacterized protein LOC116292570 n=1 Tax=Actinia tenebrosa TaxID=6105 RepID=A0A6P8HH93_ACTTE|nr:uncharacterized protein LOC116292570 [Actinia tenebrosa]